MINKFKISIIIITKNRQKKLINCLDALLANTFKSMELIIVDQSDKKNNHVLLKQKLDQFQHALYIHSKQTGKSKGLNLAIRSSTSALLAFTDDDCLPNKNWVENIVKTFNQNKKIMGVYGRTLPYQPKKSEGLICPSTFDRAKSKYIKEPCKHWEEIGFGNNMAWRKSFFEKFGVFKEWLGPGSIGNNAEDAEISLRALINKQTIFYNPKMLVHHDKWQTKKEHKKQELSYICGENACYGYLAFSGYKIGKEVIKENLIDSLFIFRENSLIKSISKLRGLTVAFYEKIKTFSQVT